MDTSFWTTLYIESSPALGMDEFIEQMRTQYGAILIIGSQAFSTGL
jgi:hypothetical protein